MKYFYLISVLLLSQFASGQNLQFRANLSYGSDVLANVWGYIDSLDNEYALVGTENGMDIVDVTNPTNPVIRFSVPGPNNNWREIKTYRKFAYVTTEGGGGLTIVDLSQLPASINSQQYTGDGSIAGQLSSIHALHCDTATGFLYLYGSNIGSGQALFLDLTDPWNPTYVGEYVFPGGSNDAYVHDGIVENDTMYQGHIYAGFFTVVDVTNKSNPVLLATQTTPTAFTHNTWLSDDHRTLFTTDENNGSFLGAFDISDLQNIREISRYQTAPGSGSVIHNTYILNDYAVTSWYKEGVVIVDVARPDNPVEVAKYDTYTQGSGTGTTGCWGVYPYLRSGTIIASDIVNGLFVFTPTYVRGCYLEGIVSDSVTTTVISSASVKIIGAVADRSTNSLGVYKTGLLTAGLYDVEVSKPGYVTKIVSGVSLANGVLTTLDVELSPLQSFAVTGTILDSLSGLPLENASVQIVNSDFTFDAITDVAGQFTIPNVFQGTYDIVSGKWGYITKCESQTINATASVQLELAIGYYDDFTFEFGWSISGTSSNQWERAVPFGSFDGNGDIANPAFDVTGDCSSQCFVTDNGTGPYNNHDVDDGTTILTSPIFDASIYVNPTVAYSRWFVNSNGSGLPNDSMVIYLSNGTDMVVLETVIFGSSGLGTWFDSNFLISPLLTATSTMQLIVYLNDEAPGHILEGGLDHFRIIGQTNVGLNGAEKISETRIRAFPNPFTHEARILYTCKEYKSGARLEIVDVIGKVLEVQSLNASEGELIVAKNLPSGVYFARIVSDNGVSSTIRIAKQ
ncbi:MAG: choice-of-anchor B family protein [Bacteroidia bacterium]|nr:choice-of-anchor B family protein [Bacteroidia bacterium]